MNTVVTRDLIIDLFDPKSVLNEIIYFQNKVKINEERINAPETNPKIKRCLKFENSRYKRWIVIDKKRLNQLLNSKTN